MDYNSTMITTLETKPSKIYERTLAHFGMIVPP